MYCADNQRDIHIELFISISMYKFESNTQRTGGESGTEARCLSVYQCTNLKAIHNRTMLAMMFLPVVYQYINVQIWKQYTTGVVDISCTVLLFISISMYKFESNTQRNVTDLLHFLCCLSVYQCTNLKAIHNRHGRGNARLRVVYQYINVQIWKQYTTNEEF